ncbi:mitochondrial import protein Pam17-domain-containing protein [Kockovaella imperatae]|uniref:Presequence translocated-associated motor subunit PAM17 n=1 Tax=Kockovaella imperatae TaxID=4999 RepID=A0A1Y1UI01_9TREE|nr:mitochondrial import protein Pam17-domain-containing protein [Kockovaella imperatae]ORX37652.1 mitochondrial import protein Pam17-domain-containing protein [Kockovaella imperatae]
MSRPAAMLAKRNVLGADIKRAGLSARAFSSSISSNATASGPSTSSAGPSRAASSSSSSTSSASTAPPAGSDSLPLTWTKYLGLRRQRRSWSTLATVPTTLTGLALGGSYFANLEADPTQLIMGIEPAFVYGGATVGCMILGYLIGPTIGSSLFSLTHPALSRGNPAPLEVMDREFFSRIKKNRVDPSFQSVNNPAPDFYGEKIVSIAKYRRWLRDQAAYKRKAMHGVPTEDQ